MKRCLLIILITVLRKSLFGLIILKFNFEPHRCGCEYHWERYIHYVELEIEQWAISDKSLFNLETLIIGSKYIPCDYNKNIVPYIPEYSNCSK